MISVFAPCFISGQGNVDLLISSSIHSAIGWLLSYGNVLYTMEVTTDAKLENIWQNGSTNKCSNTEKSVLGIIITGRFLIWFLTFRINIMMALWWLLRDGINLWMQSSTYTEYGIPDCNFFFYSRSAKFWPFAMQCSLEIIAWRLASINCLLLCLLVTIK